MEEGVTCYQIGLWLRLQGIWSFRVLKQKSPTSDLAGLIRLEVSA